MKLSTQQQNNFEAINERLGFGKGERSDLSSVKGSSDILLSANPAESSIPPKLITVHNLDELKKIVSWPDSKQPAQLAAAQPIELSHLEGKSDLNRDERYTVKMAALSYVMGHTQLLSSAAVATVNTAMFPMSLATFAIESITVKSGETLTLKDGTSPSFGQVTVEPGGQIKSDGTVTLICQSLIQEGVQPSGSYTLSVDLPPIDPPKAINGDPGDTPTETGQKGNPGTNCGKKCKSQPTDGGQGPGGQDGGGGESSLDGAHGPILTCEITSAAGNIAIYAGAQAGQNGGDGGNGGNGGPGGAPGTNVSHCTAAKTGSQGPGGKGGDGSDGGNGGNGAQVYFTYGGSATISPTKGKSVPGEAGQKGTGGMGGNGKPESKNDTKAPDGQPGVKGKPGADPIIES